jgi:hypothetical protein
MADAARSPPTSPPITKHRDGQFKTKHGPSHAEAAAFRRRQAAFADRVGCLKDFFGDMALID